MLDIKINSNNILKAKVVVNTAKKERDFKLKTYHHIFQTRFVN